MNNLNNTHISNYNNNSIHIDDIGIKNFFKNKLKEWGNQMR